MRPSEPASETTRTADAVTSGPAAAARTKANFYSHLNCGRMVSWVNPQTGHVDCLAKKDAQASANLVLGAQSGPWRRALVSRVECSFESHKFFNTNKIKTQSRWFMVACLFYMLEQGPILRKAGSLITYLVFNAHLSIDLFCLHAVHVQHEGSQSESEMSLSTPVTLSLPGRDSFFFPSPETVKKFAMRGSYKAEGWRVAILLSSVSFGALFLRYGTSAPRKMRAARLCQRSWAHV